MSADPDHGKTIGDFRFGLDTEDAQARFTESLARELKDLRDMGPVDPSLTYYDIADAILDTVNNYAGMGSVPATELSDMIRDIVEQLADEPSTEPEVLAP